MAKGVRYPSGPQTLVLRDTLDWNTTTAPEWFNQLDYGWGTPTAAPPGSVYVKVGEGRWEGDVWKQPVSVDYDGPYRAFRRYIEKETYEKEKKMVEEQGWALYEVYAVEMEDDDEGQEPSGIFFQDTVLAKSEMEAVRKVERMMVHNYETVPDVDHLRVIAVRIRSL